MPLPQLTPEQQRIRALFAGDPTANFAQPVQPQANPALAPTAYNNTSTTQAYTDFTTASPSSLSMVTPSNSYQTALRQRLNSISDLATNPNQQAAAAQQQRMMAANAAVANTGGIGPNPASYFGTKSNDARRNAVLQAAASQNGMPYSWGGGNAKGPTEGGANTRSTRGGPVGFDCSGLVLYAFAQIGIKMPHYNQSQLAMGVKMPINKLSPGDLVGTAGHVAIYAGNGMMWEAPTFGKQVRLVPVRAGMFGVHINY